MGLDGHEVLKIPVIRHPLDGTKVETQPRVLCSPRPQNVGHAVFRFMSIPRTVLATPGSFPFKVQIEGMEHVQVQTWNGELIGYE